MIQLRNLFHYIGGFAFAYAIGSLIGFGLSTLVSDLKVISVYLFLFCLMLLILDTVFAIINKNKK